MTSPPSSLTFTSTTKPDNIILRMLSRDAISGLTELELQAANRVLSQLAFVDDVCCRRRGGYGVDVGGGESCGLAAQLPGVDRLQRRCEAERRFVLGLLSAGGCEVEATRLEQLRSSNASQLCAVARELDSLPDCCSVLQKFPTAVCKTTPATTTTTSKSSVVEVDLVCRGGGQWVKCVARNPRGLRQACSGQNDGSSASLLQQAGCLLAAAALAGPAPGAIRLRVHCAAGVTPRLRDRLLAVGVAEVTGEVVVDEEETDADYWDAEVDEGGQGKDSVVEDGWHCGAVGSSVLVSSHRMYASPLQPAIDTPSNQYPAYATTPLVANLDVTCLVALTTNLCRSGRRGCRLHFREQPLALTARLERNQPCLPKLKAFLAGAHRLVACATAVSEFRAILDTVAGPTERRRAEKWLARLEQIPDQCPQGLRDRLRLSRSVQLRHLAVFGTGAAIAPIGAGVTVTGNARFVRAAAKQGVHFRVHMHGCRPFTEAKEAAATELVEGKDEVDF